MENFVSRHSGHDMIDSSTFKAEKTFTSLEKNGHIPEGDLPVYANA